MRNIDADKFLKYLASYAVSSSDMEFCDKVAYAINAYCKQQSEPDDKDGWTLCKDKLPERGWYSVTFKGEPAFTSIAFFNGYHWMNVEKGSVVAWAEQKKPYMGES